MYKELLGLLLVAAIAIQSQASHNEMNFIFAGILANHRVPVK